MKRVVKQALLTNCPPLLRYRAKYHPFRNKYSFAKIIGYMFIFWAFYPNCETSVYTDTGSITNTYIYPVRSYTTILIKFASAPDGHLAY